MEGEIKILEAIIEECRAPHFKLDFMDIQALRSTLDRLKEDEAVIHEMAKEIIILDEIGQSKCSGCRNKRKEQKCIECRITDFRNKVKGEKE